jgi:hypothetical protein
MNKLTRLVLVLLSSALLGLSLNSCNSGSSAPAGLRVVKIVPQDGTTNVNTAPNCCAI